MQPRFFPPEFTGQVAAATKWPMAAVERAIDATESYIERAGPFPLDKPGHEAREWNQTWARELIAAGGLAPEEMVLFASVVMGGIISSAYGRVFSDIARLFEEEGKLEAKGVADA